MVLACLVQWDEFKRAWFLPRHIWGLPYAVPAFISILVFKGLFNQSYGEINMFLALLGFDKPEWYTEPDAMRAMILIVTWLGYPYMMILCMGLLKSIPESIRSIGYGWCWSDPEFLQDHGPANEAADSVVDCLFRI